MLLDIYYFIYEKNISLLLTRWGHTGVFGLLHPNLFLLFNTKYATRTKVKLHHLLNKHVFLNRI